MKMTQQKFRGQTADKNHGQTSRRGQKPRENYNLQRRHVSS